MIRASDSRRTLAALRSSITLVMEERVVSSFSAREVSAARTAAVSVDNWSIRAKARVKEASMEALSDSICGGVGGDIKGRI